MRLFFKLFWGFRVEDVPIVPIGYERAMKHLIHEMEDGDRIVFVTTSNKPTDDHERGMILGMAEIRREACRTEDFVPANRLPLHLLLPDGSPRFPFAVPVVRAWRFDTPVPRTKIFHRIIGMNQATYVKEMLPSETEALLAEPHAPVLLPQTRVWLNLERQHRAGRSHHPSPPPSSGERMFVIEEGESAHVYALRYGEGDVWKIGFAKAPYQRLHHFNATIPSPDHAEGWHMFDEQKMCSSAEAYAFERILHQAFRSAHLRNEMFCCSEAEFERLWQWANQQRKNAA